MSATAYAKAARDFLRENLVNFYNGIAEHQAANCKVMPNDQPAANCGQEFIGIYPTFFAGGDYMQGIEEELGLTVAISRKIAWVPPDYRGEKGLIDIYPLAIEDIEDSDAFTTAWASLDSRCREVVKLLSGGTRYEVMYNANQNLSTGTIFTEPISWQRTSVPQQVGAEHFYSNYVDIPDSDPVFGLLAKVYFTGAKRLQPMADLDDDGV